MQGLRLQRGVALPASCPHAGAHRAYIYRPGLSERGRAPVALKGTREDSAPPVDLELLGKAEELQLPLESELAQRRVGVGDVLLARPGQLTPGQVVGGKYTLKEVLGSGSNAITYRAAGPDGANVAVKVLSLKGLRDWKQLELFQREAQVLKSLNHEGIPRYLDYFEEDTDTDRCFYIVQEIAPGRSLAALLADGGRATEDEVLRIARAVLGVLRYLGSLRPPVVHRDIKPENIVIEGGKWGGRVYVIDFGGVQGVVAAGDASRFASTIIGTYGYMAPEQFRGQAVPASDMYALGGTLLFLASGQAPSSFSQERMRLNYRDKVTVGRQLGQLLDGMLEPIVEDRVSAEEALAILDGAPSGRRRAAASSSSPASAAAPAAVARRNSPGTGSYLGRQLRKPAGTRVLLERSPGRLELEVPPEGLSGNSVSTGAFAVVWNAFVAFWTFSALASGGLLFALFSAPFWFAGWQLAGQALSASLMRERFAIGRNKFRLSQELAVLKEGVARFLGDSRRLVEGDSADLTGARLVTTIIVNGEPRYAVELVEGVNKHRFGEGLAEAEQLWVVQEINSHLEQLRGQAPSEEELGETDAPLVYNDPERLDGWDRDDDRWSRS